MNCSVFRTGGMGSQPKQKNRALVGNDSWPGSAQPWLAPFIPSFHMDALEALLMRLL